MISIQGLDKAAVLAALYNASAPRGMGFLQYVPGPMTVEQAREVIAKRGDDMKAMFGVSLHGSMYFDYVNGRPLKVDLKGEELNPAGYDGANGGAGAAERALAELRSTGMV